LSTNCLLIIKNDSPLNLAMEMLLGPGSDILAVKSNANDFQGLVNEVCALKSEVVVFEDEVAMTEKNSVTHLLMSNPELKVIVIFRDSNYIHIFRKDEILIKRASEFLDLIRSKEPSTSQESANL